MVNEPGTFPYRRRLRPTRRGKAMLLLGGALVAAATIAAPLLVLEDGPEMSMEEAVSSSLVIPEGWRAGQIYTAIDQALDVPPGTTEKAMPEARLPLPPAAHGNPEGYLFPATYPIRSDTTPGSLLRYMVETASQRFGDDRIAAGAPRNGISAYQAVTLASVIQAEADTASDMGKVGRVVYNRLHRDMPLQMDSTLNYALRRSTLDTTTEDTRIDSPYNTYRRKGLPPTPIGNPGEEAMRAAIGPTAGPWLYFVTVGPGDTRFTESYQAHTRNVAEFNRNRESAAPAG
ncbi:endolytic transglycosylase MltG [Streptomyces sp. NBC_00102]|uniref:endolytic transglycosylase MltG n=1 Tax=Streptomyces sp. NBC_00102 TaxID=2975652 RepID=UPI002250A611|nr:endolytic transglycosylase MltG [Streptomyces sp. NBC_00102]MCX5402403.1 endolytic transglycosylase MltG [Streptomyces sp. NBC_00102]